MKEIFKHSYLSLKEILDGNINFFIEKTEVKEHLNAFAWNELLNKKEIYVPNYNEKYNNGDLKISIDDYMVEYNTITVKAIITMEYWHDEHTLRKMVSKSRVVFNRLSKQIDRFKMELVRFENVE